MTRFHLMLMHKGAHNPVIPVLDTGIFGSKIVGCAGFAIGLVLRNKLNRQTLLVLRFAQN